MTIFAMEASFEALAKIDKIHHTNFRFQVLDKSNLPKCFKSLIIFEFLLVLTFFEEVEHTK